MERPLPPYPARAGSFVLDPETWEWVRAKSTAGVKALAAAAPAKTAVHPAAKTDG
jgi:hypothetical protein